MTLGNARRGRLEVGTGRTRFDIPASLFPIEGYSGVQDDLFARALLLDDGMERAVIVVADLTSILPPVSDYLRRIISREGDVAFENTVLSASHTFSTPHPKLREEGRSAYTSPHQEAAAQRDDVFLEVVTMAITRSVCEAKERMQPGRMGFGSGQCHVNVNRDVLTSKGWWRGRDFEGSSDKTLAVMRFETPEGTPLALYINYPVQSSVVAQAATRLVSADLGGATARYVEDWYRGEVVALWNVGAAGDQAPLLTASREIVDRNGDFRSVEIREGSHVLLELLGEVLGYEAVRIGESIRGFTSDVTITLMERTISCPGQEIIKDLGDLAPRKEYEYIGTGPRQVPFAVLVVADVAIVAVQVELNSRTALQIKEASPFEKTVIMTMANGAAKYLPDAESYDKITYASMNSMYAKGSAEILRDAIVSALEQVASP